MVPRRKFEIPNRDRGFRWLEKLFSGSFKVTVSMKRNNVLLILKLPWELFVVS